MSYVTFCMFIFVTTILHYLYVERPRNPTSITVGNIFLGIMFCFIPIINVVIVGIACWEILVKVSKIKIVK